MQSTKHIQQVMEPIFVPPENNVWMSRAVLMQQRSVKVDIVAEKGLVWVKVIARNAKALRHDMAGLEGEMDEDFQSDDSSEEDEEGGTLVADDAFEQLPIFKKAKEYLRSAEAHHVHFRAPKVVFAFMRLYKDQQDMFVERIMDRLRELGIVVYTGGNQDLRSTYIAELGSEHLLSDLTTSSLNLDVSTVLALLSEMAHAPCPPDQVEGEALRLQAEREREAPVLPVLKQLLKGKALYMVQSAFDRLRDIVQVVAGPREQARFRYLFRLDDDNPFDTSLWTLIDEELQINVLPDAVSDRFRQLLEPPPRKGKLNNGRKIRSKFSEFHAIIFGSGDTYRMTTITAIQWMKTALEDAGLTGIAIVSHEPRSLAEQKMHRYR